MARINLLPWREELRKEQQRQFLTIMGLSVVLMLLIIVAVHIQISGMISHQKDRNDFLKREITKVEKQIKEINELAKKKKSLIRAQTVEKRHAFSLRRVQRGLGPEPRSRRPSASSCSTRSRKRSRRAGVISSGLSSAMSLTQCSRSFWRNGSP